MRAILFLIVLLASVDASAAYVWVFSGRPGTFADPVSACKSFPTSMKFKRADKTAVATQFQCVWEYPGSPSTDYPQGTVVRSGSGCDVNYTYNANTGFCEPPPPDPGCGGKAGTSIAFSKTGTAPDAYMALSNGYGAPVQSGCFGGCLASTADQKCVTKTTGAYGCRGTAWFTGAACGTEPGVDSSSSSASPDPETKTDTQPACTPPLAASKSAPRPRPRTLRTDLRHCERRR